MSVVKNNEMQKGGLTKKQENSYNRFFQNAFNDADIDEIIESGGAETKENFISSAKDNIKDKGYWDALMIKAIKNKTYAGRDGKKRKSFFQANYNSLADAIYQERILPLADPRVTFIEYSRKGKTKTFYTVRKTVTKGKTIEFGGKVYKGGQFLSSKFKVKN